MGFRDDDLAGRERIEVLQRDLDALREENESLRAAKTAARPNLLAPAALVVAALAIVATALAFMAGWRIPTHGDDLGIALAVTATLLVVAAIALAVVGRHLILVAPNELVVLSGRSTHLPDGSTVGYRVVHAGRAFRVPILERADRIALTPMELDTWIRGAYARKGVPVDVRFRARVEITRYEPLVRNAIERFLGRDHDEIARVARESLEGALRGVVAQVTFEELREDALKVAEHLLHEVEHDLDTLGLTIESFHLLEVLPS